MSGRCSWGNSQGLFLSRDLSFPSCGHLSSQVICEVEIPMDCVVAKKLSVCNPDTTSMVSTLSTEELAPWLLKQKRPEALSPDPVRQLTSHPKDPCLRGEKKQNSGCDDSIWL